MVEATNKCSLIAFITITLILHDEHRLLKQLTPFTPLEGAGVRALALKSQGTTILLLSLSGDCGLSS